VTDHKRVFLQHLRLRGITPATLVYQAIYLDQFLSFLALRGLDETRTTPRDMERYKVHALTSHNPRWKKQRPVKLDTLHQRLSTVKKYFAFLKERGVVMFNPTDNMTLPRVKRNPPKNIPTASEMERLLNAPDLSTPQGLRDKAFMEVLYSAGLRRGEALSLKVYDVDFADGTVRVEKGKNGMGRVVPMGAAARRAVGEYIRDGRQRMLDGAGAKKPRRRRPSPPVGTALFLNEDGGRLRWWSVNPTIKKYARWAAIDKKVTAHSFRHACATHMLRGGANVRVVQRMLGHASILSTQIYTHVLPGDLKEVLAKHHPRGRWKNRNNHI
jgi:integrase/recombinase XerD